MLENIIKKIKNSKFYETGRNMIYTEWGAVIGNFVGSHFSHSNINNDIGITGGVISGDYIGGTFGQFLAYKHNNPEKDAQALAKDFTKILIYDFPNTALAYTISGAVTYQFVKRDADEKLVAFVNWLTTAATWQFIYNKIVYPIVRDGKDENLAKHLYTRGKELYKKLRS